MICWTKLQVIPVVSWIVCWVVEVQIIWLMLQCVTTHTIHQSLVKLLKMPLPLMKLGKLLLNTAGEFLFHNCDLFWTYVHFSKCKSCRERYSTAQTHRIKGDRNLALNCDYVNRCAVTKQHVLQDGDTPEHCYHSDGCGRDSWLNTKPGVYIYLAPGTSRKEYETCARDSPSR